jgi:hypothetical protein
MSQDFRRALDLRSTWFSWRVLNLRVQKSRALASGGKAVALTGFVRGVSRVWLDRQVNGGSWQTVRRLKPRANGRFTATVKPMRTTSYRLRTGAGAGAAITVRAS